MGLEYDFDIVKVAQDQTDPAEAGGQPDTDRPVRAVFRDIRTADALRGTSPKIRAMFLDAGFSLESRRSGIAAGVFPAEDLADRVQVLYDLFDNIRRQGVQGEYCGDFDLWQFLDHVRRARPAAGVIRPAPRRVPPHSTEVKPKRRPLSGRIGFALGVAVMLFALLKYLAAAGASP